MASQRSSGEKRKRGDRSNRPPRRHCDLLDVERLCVDQVDVRCRRRQGRRVRDGKRTAVVRPSPAARVGECRYATDAAGGGALRGERAVLRAAGAKAGSSCHSSSAPGVKKRLGCRHGEPRGDAGFVPALDCGQVRDLAARPQVVERVVALRAPGG
jgi:hypothetical protein